MFGWFASRRDEIANYDRVPPVQRIEVHHRVGVDPTDRGRLTPRTAMTIRRVRDISDPL
jgi:hypothetical protein